MFHNKSRKPATVDGDLMANPVAPLVVNLPGSLTAAQQERQRIAFNDQIVHAIQIIRNLDRPRKWGFIAQQFHYAEYRGVERIVRETPGIKVTRHKMKLYYYHT